MLSGARFRFGTRRAACTLAAVLLVPFLLYFQTLKSMVAVWDSSGTFAHGYAVLPISLWLVWRRREALPLHEAGPWWPGLYLLAGCGFAWLAADVAEVQVIRQYAFVAMLPLIVLTMLGPRVTKTMAFPLLFLLLAVPFGEVFIGPLVDFTADFTVAALRMTGIPVLRNGTHFEIPSGSWSVLKACSGIRYLISSFTLGLLYAYLTYRSTLRRLAFVLLAIVTPILANGARAYMIVMIGHLSGMRLAVGVDHIIYGWLFFGLVMFTMFWIGSFWREDRPDDTADDFPDNRVRPEARPGLPDSGRFAGPALAVCVCLAVWPLYSHYVHRSNLNRNMPDLSGFAAGWPPAEAFTEWQPHFLPAAAGIRRFYKRGSQTVGLTVLYYRSQDAHSKLISSSNQLVPREKNAAWVATGSALRKIDAGDTRLTLRETRVQGPKGQFLVWSWYWVDRRFTSNDYLAKLLQAKQELGMQGDDGAAIVLFAPFGEQPDQARAAMSAFLARQPAPLTATLEGTRND